MPVPKFSSHLTAPREAEEDDVSAYNDTRRMSLLLLTNAELEPDRPIANYRSGEYLRKVIATENKKLKSKL